MPSKSRPTPKRLSEGSESSKSVDGFIKLTPNAGKSLPKQCPSINCDHEQPSNHLTKKPVSAISHSGNGGNLRKSPKVPANKRRHTSRLKSRSNRGIDSASGGNSFRASDTGLNYIIQRFSADFKGVLNNTFLGVGGQWQAQAQSDWTGLGWGLGMSDELY